MSKPSLRAAPPGIEGGRRVRWPVGVGLALLLPILEWAGGRVLRWSGVPLTAASLWATTLAVNGLFVALLFGAAGRAIRVMWSVPRLKDIGLTLAAVVAGWMVIPLAQWAVPFFLSASASDGSGGVSLVPATGLDMVLLVLASFVGAVGQETVYRGLLWERLESLTRNRWVALIGSSLVFGLIYADGGLSNYLSVGVAWGFVAGSLYLVTRRLSTVVLLNALNMFLTYAVLFRYML